MSAKTMAEVLAEHDFLTHERSQTYACSNTECGWEFRYRLTADDLKSPVNVVTLAFAAHQAEMLTAAGYGLVADAKAEALEEAAEEFESHVGVGEFAEQSTRGGAHWAHIEEDWEHQGPYMDWLRNRAESLRQS